MHASKPAAVPGTPSKPAGRREAVIAALVLGAIVVCALPSLRGTWVWDDLWTWPYHAECWFFKK